MVYKGAKYLRFVASATARVDYAGYANRTGRSLAAEYADKAGITTSSKASALRGGSAYAVAQNVASLTNQGGGNIGFTYE